MKITCDNCGAKYSIADEKVRGKVFKIRCKKCSNIIVVRGTEGAAAAEPAAEPAAGTAQEAPTWHVVVGREQVGPMTATEVRERFAEGDISAESYVWKEGFGDWQRLSAVDEFKDIGQSTVFAAASAGEAEASAPEPAASEQERWDHGLSGDSAGDDWAGAPAAAESPAQEPNAPFGGTAGNDLFGSGVSASAPKGEDSVQVGGGPVLTSSPEDGGQDASVQDLAGAATSDPAGQDAGQDAAGGGLFGNVGGDSHIPSDPAVPVDTNSPQMTGQRGENSVLFSLANLQALAMGDDKKSASGGAAASAEPAPSPAAGGGSGLIDIRAMAATTAAAKAEDAPQDDLPVLGGFAAPMATAAPVLLPTAADDKPKWVLPTIIGIGAALVVAIAVLVVVLLGDKPPTQPTTVAAVAPGSTAADSDKTEPKGGGTDSKESGDEKAASAKAKTEPTAAATATPTAAPESGDAAKAPAAKKPSRRKGRTARKRTRTKTRTAAPAKATTPRRPASTGRTKPRGKRDELDALIDGALGSKKRRGTRKAAAAPAPSNLPERLNRGQILGGMRKVSPRVRACYDRFKVPGLAMVKVTIAKTGRVSAAVVTGLFAGTPTGACVSRAVKKARFAQTKSPTTIRYPFNLR